MLFYTSSLAGAGPRKGEGEEREGADRTLKTIQKRETRKKKDSEDSEEFRCGSFRGGDPGGSGGI